VIDRIARTMAVACVVMAIGFALWKRNLAGPLGVLGGGLLIGLSFWAIRGTVDTLMAGQASLSRGGSGGANAGENGKRFTGFSLVKFFTRHGIVALAAYGMMIRLRVDPIGLLVGVSSLGVAVAVEVLRDLRWRRFP
jgi:hypothetical protein